MDYWPPNNAIDVVLKMILLTFIDNMNFLKKYKIETIQIGILFVPNLICWFLLYPGYFQADHQELIANIACGSPNQALSLVWGYLSFPFIYFTPSYAYYGIFQIMIFTFCIIFGIYRLRKCGFVQHPIVLTIFMGVFPTFLLYNLLYSSELFLAYFVFDITCLLIEYIKGMNNVKFCKSFWIWLFLFVSLACLIRKTAMLIPLCIVLLSFVFKQKHFKQFMYVGISSLLCLFIVSESFSMMFSAEKASTGGAFACVPSYQVAGVYAKNGFIPDDAKYVFERIKPPEEWKREYEVASADGSLSNVDFNSDFLMAYLETGLYNIGSYIRSYLRLEGPLYLFSDSISFDFKDRDNGTKIDFGQWDGITLKYLNESTSPDDLRYLIQFNTQHSKLWHQVPKKIIECHYSRYGLYPAIVDVILFNRALPFWVLLVGLLVSIKVKKIKEFIFVSIPVFSIFIVFAFCCPVVLFRYIVEMYYTLPLIVFFMIKISKGYHGLKV